MDFFFEDIPSTSQSTPRKEHEDTQMSEDPGLDSSRERSTSSTSTTENIEQRSNLNIDDISRRAQEMVEEINHSRTKDQKVIDTFLETLEEKVTEMCQQMKEHMYTVYEENSNEMQVKLQELSKVLEVCSKLSGELQEAVGALSFLREGLGIPHKPEP